jgi:hypothetical protein
MTSQSELIKRATTLIVQSQAFLLTHGRWSTSLIIGVPCSLLLFFIELVQREGHLYILHLFCSVIYYSYAHAKPTSLASTFLPTLSYVAFSVQTKRVLCSLLPPDAG